MTICCTSFASRNEGVEIVSYRMKRVLVGDDINGLANGVFVEPHQRQLLQALLHQTGVNIGECTRLEAAAMFKLL
jgi:hypothetical protein